MKNKRPIAPGFINKLDNYLLLNKPGAWSARAHLVVYYTLLFALALTATCFLVPDDPREGSNVFVWSFLVSVLAAIGFIVWLIFLLRFNVFKRFGLVTKGDKLLTFLLYFISVAAMVAIIYIPSVVETYKANRTYGNDEVVNDINTMNLAICQLNADSIPRKLKVDTFAVKEQPATIRYNRDGEVMLNGHTAHFHEIDSADFATRKDYTDSMVKINDSVFVFFRCPYYNFVSDQSADAHTKLKLLKSPAIYAMVFAPGAVVDKKMLQEKLTRLLQKYDSDTMQIGYNETYPARDINLETDGYSDDERYLKHMSDKYGLNGVNRSIGNITDRKYRWAGSSAEAAIRVFYYSSLVLSLLVFIFRQSTVKTFFLTVLVGVILFILTSLFFAVGRGSTGSVFICCIVYFLCFVAGACTVFVSKTRRAVNGIALNFLVFFTVFMPVLVTAFYYQLLREKERLMDENWFTKYEQETRHYLYAEIIGLLLLLLLIETGFKKLYRRWYALPEA